MKESGSVVTVLLADVADSFQVVRLIQEFLARGDIFFSVPDILKILLKHIAHGIFTLCHNTATREYIAIPVDERF